MDRLLELHLVYNVDCKDYVTRCFYFRLTGQTISPSATQTTKFWMPRGGQTLIWWKCEYLPQSNEYGCQNRYGWENMHVLDTYERLWCTFWIGLIVSNPKCHICINDSIVTGLRKKGKRNLNSMPSMVKPTGKVFMANTSWVSASLDKLLEHISEWLS